MPDYTKSNENFNGMYRGIVEDNEDPEDTGRVKVRVFGVYGEEVDDDALPWALPAAPITHDSRATDVTGGDFRVPKTGQNVWVFFDHGDHMQPVYFAKAVSGPDWTENRTAVDSFLNAIKNAISSFLSAFSMQSDLSIDDLPDNKDISVRATEEGEVRITDHENNRSILLTEEKIERSSLKKVFVDGNSEEGVEEDKNVNIKGNAKREIKENHDEIIEGNENRLIKKNRTKEIGEDQELTVGGDEEITIVGKKTENVGGNKEILIIGDCTITVMGNVTLTSGKNISISSGGITTIN